jgi:hypothetical protein
LGRAHLNLIDASRRFFALDPDAEVEAGDGRLFGAGTPEHPVISNAVFRANDDLGGSELIERAKEFFGERGRGFSVWVRDGRPEDADLIEAAEAAGLRTIYEMPEMILTSPPRPVPASSGTDLRRLRTTEDAADFWEVARPSYGDLGWPPEVFEHYTDSTGLLAEDVAAFTAYRDGAPVAIAMTIVSHGVAGIYWVGALRSARGAGLGRAMTTAATEAGLELGADFASLQASPMGKPIYEAMGFETAYDYRLLISPRP